MSNRLPIPALILALLIAAPTHAATWVVTRVDDPSPGACLPGDCSLREAVLGANGAPGPDRIELGPGVHQMDRGELLVTEAIEIAGQGGTTVRGDGIATVLRLGPGVAAQVRDVRIDGPNPFDASGAPLRGSVPDGIRVESGGSLLLERGRVTLGGGRVTSLAGSATIELRSSTVVLLRCGHQSGLCRALDSDVQMLSVAGGQVEFRRSAVTGALVPAIDSGASIETTGAVLFEDATVADTYNGLSFQSQVPQSVNLRRFSYLRNGSPLLARVPLAVAIEDAEFADNRNRWSGDDGGPAAIHAYIGASFDVERSSFIGNIGTGPAGGAILVEGNASLRLANSTLSGNSFTVEAAATGARGGAVAVRAGQALTRVDIVHSTVVAPSLLPVGVIGSAFSATGADAQIHLAVHNSIVRGSCSFGLVPGQMDEARGNIKNSGDDCGFDAALNQTGVDNAALALGALGDHGAFGRTYLPGPGSVAIDTAAPVHCTELDQRAFPRLLPGVLCDVGAIEVEADDLLFANGFEG